MDILDRASASLMLKKADKSMKHEEYMRALRNYLKVLRIKLELKDEEGLDILYRHIADCYSKIEATLERDNVKNTKNSAEYYEKSAGFSLKRKDYHNAALSYAFAGNCNESLGDDKKAAEIDKKAAELFNEIGEDYEASHSFVESAKYYEKIAAYDKAAYCYQKASEIDINLNDITRASKNYKNVAKCYKTVGKYMEAIDTYTLTLGLDEKTGNYPGTAYSHEEIASCNESLKNYKDAIDHHLKAVMLYKKEGKSKDAIRNYQSIGDDYEQIKDYKGALDHYIKASEVSSSIRDKEQEATSLKKVAKFYEKLNDYDNAIKNYVFSADANMSLGKGMDALESYKKSIKLNLKVAKKLEKSPEKAATYYESVAECYTKLKDNEMAADYYLLEGEMDVAASDTEKAKDSFLKAADGYARTKNIEKAVDCYIRAKAYEKAAESCDRIVDNLSKKKDNFSAGKWLLIASWCYVRMNRQSKVKEYCDKVKWQYGRFIDEEMEKDKQDASKLAFAHKNIGECHIRMDLYPKALHHLEKSFELYQTLKDKQHLEIVRAQLYFIRASLLSKEIKYGEALKLLNDSIKRFEHITKKEMDVFYKEYLKARVDDAKSLIKLINARPYVSLIVIQPPSLKAGTTFKLNGVITNKGDRTINKIAFQTFVPEGIEVTGAPEEIPELKPKESRKIQLEITPAIEGNYDIKPLEVLYHDADDRRYMKSSNKISVDVGPEEPEPETGAGISEIESKLKVAFSETRNPITLFSYSHEKYTDMLIAILGFYKDMKMGGVYLSVSKPSTYIIKLLNDKEIPVDDIYFVDCVSYMAGEEAKNAKNAVFVENPASLEEMSMYVDKFMVNVDSQQKFFIIDSLSSLLIYNEDRAVEELTHFIINKMRIKSISGAIFTTKDDVKRPVVRTILNECDKEIRI